MIHSRVFHFQTTC